MKATRDEMKKEAIKLMKKMKIYGSVIRTFKNDDIIEDSEPPIGACYDLETEMVQAKEEVEKKYGVLVYHMVRSWTEMGEMWAFLVVSQYKEEWADIEDNVKDGYVYSYVHNVDEPMFSEFGDIVVERTVAGGLRRIG